MSNETPENVPNKLSTAAIIAFVLVVFTVSNTIGFGQSIAWFMEQVAGSSGSAAFLAFTGRIWFVVQAGFVLGIAGIFFYFSHNALRPVYKSWLVATLVMLPAFGLRFIDPNQDQPGALIQIIYGLMFGVIILWLRRKSLDFTGKGVLTALVVVPLTIWPFLLWGAFGAPTEIFLNLLAGLAFGLLATSLMAKTTGEFLLDGLNISVLLAILGSAFGYDGGQLLLIIVLPAFGFALAAISPSVPARVIAVGLLTAATLTFIDPTELSIVLSDFFGVGIGMTLLAMLNALVIALPLWLLGKWRSRPQTVFIPAAFGIWSWACAVALFLFFGQHGFHGDRLFVILKEQANLAPAAQIKDTGKRKAYVYETLTKTATSSQLELIQNFKQFSVAYTPYYLVNAIEVDDNPLVRLYLLTRPEVDRVLASPRLRPLPQKGEAESGKYDSISENPGWNIKMIGANKVWDEFNITGSGIIIGQSDSGVDGTHPTLSAAYRGKTEGDDFNWYDPWNHTSSPTDKNGHGTHTMGTMLGTGGIGVAPGAQWIGCVNLGRNLANPAFYLDCMQFNFAPFAQDGDPFKGDPARGAQVLNNSWGCPPVEGCDIQSLEPAVDALRAAGVFVVVSTGNDGPSCKTVNTPLALYDSVFSVGAVDQFGGIAKFSSRGPVTVDGSGRVKPDIVAPGEDVFSAMPGGTYAKNSGTSMAGPHLVGVVALLWSADPALIGDIDRTEQILIETAKPISSTADECSNGSTPNNTFGYGLVDVYAAVNMALGNP